jgi:hypothetical protein
MSKPDDELDIRQTLNVLRRLAEPNGLITSDLEWAEAKLKAYTEGQVSEAYKKGYIQRGIDEITL